MASRCVFTLNALLRKRSCSSGAFALLLAHRSATNVNARNHGAQAGVSAQRPWCQTNCLAKPAGEVSPKTTSSAFARDVQGVSGAFVSFRLPNVVWNYLANLKAQPPSWGHWQIAPGLGPW